MHGIFDKLKQKGPGGIPVGAWAGILAVVLYLAYRHFRGSAGSTSAGAAPTTAADGSAVTPTAGFGDSTIPGPYIPPSHVRRRRRVKSKPRHKAHPTPTDHRQGHPKHRPISGGHNSHPPLHRKRHHPKPRPQLGGGGSVHPPFAEIMSLPSTGHKRDVGTPGRLEGEHTGYPDLAPTTPPRKAVRKNRARGHR